MVRVALPHGLTVSAPCGADVPFIHAEIFEQHCYERFGITLAHDAIVVDVGANIGLFALRVKQLAPDARVVCVEPVPPTYACLTENLAGYPDVVCVERALCDRVGSTTITYFPTSPGNSTLHPEHKPEEADAFARAATLRWLWRFDKLTSAFLVLVYPLRRPLLRLAFRRLFRRAQTFACPTGTLDQLLAEHAIARVDLLKIDVEGAERAVLAGLSNEQLARVQQLIVEISPQHKAWLPELERRLRDQGFAHLHLDAMVEGSDPRHDALPCNLFARR